MAAIREDALQVRKESGSAAGIAEAAQSARWSCPRCPAAAGVMFARGCRGCVKRFGFVGVVRGEAIPRSGSMPAVKMPDEGWLCQRWIVSCCVGLWKGRRGVIGKVVGTARCKSHSGIHAIVAR